jgi:hypothetical protein
MKVKTDFSLQGSAAGGNCKSEMILIFERVRSVITPKQVDNQICLLTCSPFAEDIKVKLFD